MARKISVTFEIVEAAAFALTLLILAPQHAAAGDDGEGHGHHHEHKEDGHRGHQHEDQSTVLSDGAIKASNIGLAEAAPRSITTTLTLNGRIVPNADRLAHITPRFPGILTAVYRSEGDAVGEGDTLAQIESNESLRSYPVRSLIAGTIVRRHASRGEFVGVDQDLFLIADLSTVWAEFQLFPGDYDRVRRNQSITVTAAGKRLEAEISYVSAFSDSHTQAKVVRAVLPNEARELLPGLFARAEVHVDTTRVPVAVQKEALHVIEDKTVIFVRSGNTFSPRHVKTGREDAKWVEVIDGIAAGETYAAANSFIVKADVLKSGAAHHHH